VTQQHGVGPHIPPVKARACPSEDQPSDPHSKSSLGHVPQIVRAAALLPYYPEHVGAAGVSASVRRTSSSVETGNDDAEIEAPRQIANRHGGQSGLSPWNNCVILIRSFKIGFDRYTPSPQFILRAPAR
jgi:hypothetical protein